MCYRRLPITMPCLPSLRCCNCAAYAYPASGTWGFVLGFIGWVRTRDYKTESEPRSLEGSPLGRLSWWKWLAFVLLFLCA